MPNAQPTALPFRFIAGDASLDFVNTLDWTSPRPVKDRWPGYADLTRWAEEAGVMSAADGARLRRRAAANPAGAARALAAAKRVRSTLRELFTGVARNGRVAPGLLAELNGWLAEASSRRLVMPASKGKGPLAWRWRGMGEELGAIAWPVVAAAAALLTSDELGQVRVCSADDCGWLFVDRSRNGLRRWCQMDTCGGRAKARRHYARVRAARKS